MIATWAFRMFAPGRASANGNGVARAARARASAIGNGASPSPLVDPDDVLAFEFGRARRYECALSIVVVVPTSWPGEHDVHYKGDEPRSTVLPLLTAAGLRETLRETDIMCYEPLEGRFVLGLTESKAEAARCALERVRTLFQSRLRIELAIGVAQFPSDGVTLADLVRAARLRAGSTQAVEGEPLSREAAQTSSTRSTRTRSRAVRANAAESASNAIRSK